MKKIFITQWLITISLYVFIYLCKTFIYLEFTNPFQWIVDLPKYTVETRSSILFFILLYYCGGIFFLWLWYKSHKTEKDSENGNCKEGNYFFAKNEYNGIPTHTFREYEVNCTYEEYKSISNRLKTQDHNGDYVIQRLDYNPMKGTLKIKDKTRIF